jgi:hypothetical protein
MTEYKNLKLKPEVLYQVNEDGMMIYVPEEGMIHAVNVTAADVVLFIEQGSDAIESVVNELAGKYIGVSKEELYDDVKGILNSLTELDIIQGV